MWLDEQKYKDLDKLSNIVAYLRDIIVQENGLLMHQSFKNVLNPKPDDPNVKWNSVILYQTHKHFELSYVDERFATVQSMIKETSSIVQAVINYIGPESITPLHRDSQECGEVEGSQQRVPTYQLMAGIYTPIGDIGLKFNDVARSWKDNEVLAFDGETPHCGWNNTKEYRIALYLDVTKESFNDI